MLRLVEREPESRLLCWHGFERRYPFQTASPSERIGGPGNNAERGRSQPGQGKKELSRRKAIRRVSDVVYSGRKHWHEFIKAFCRFSLSAVNMMASYRAAKILELDFYPGKLGLTFV